MAAERRPHCIRSVISPERCPQRRRANVMSAESSANAGTMNRNINYERNVNNMQFLVKFTLKVNSHSLTSVIAIASGIWWCVLFIASGTRRKTAFAITRRMLLWRSVAHTTARRRSGRHFLVEIQIVGCTAARAAIRGEFVAHCGNGRKGLQRCQCSVRGGKLLTRRLIGAIGRR